jgi:hypothetical protein
MLHTQRFMQAIQIHKHDLHRPVSYLTFYQKGVYFAGIKWYKKLPLKIKHVSIDNKNFKAALKEFLLIHTSHFVYEYVLLRKINRL